MRQTSDGPRVPQEPLRQTDGVHERLTKCVEKALISTQLYHKIYRVFIFETRKVSKKVECNLQSLVISVLLYHMS